MAKTIIFRLGRGLPLEVVVQTGMSWLRAHSAKPGIGGFRAGWRLIIFFAVLLPLGYVASHLVDAAFRKLHLDYFSPLGGFILGAVMASALLLASLIMARLEGRSLATYGLPARRAFCSQFWQGAVISLLSLTLLLFVMRLLGAVSFASGGLRGIDPWRYGLLWMVPLFLVALLEDFFYRGYLLYTLATGIGFWPAAVVTSLLMGGAHYFNPGGHGLGPIAATAYCLVTALVIQRTGDLWMALGIHWAWSWGEVFLYGVPSSGQSARGHLLRPTFHGSLWVTGGDFGPEASWLNLLLIAIWAVGFWLWLKPVEDDRAYGRTELRVETE